MAIADFNNDNRSDIVVASYNDSNIDIFFGYGNGSFADQATYSAGFDAQPYSVATGHFNSDAYIDIIFANYAANNVIVLLGLEKSFQLDLKLIHF